MLRQIEKIPTVCATSTYFNPQGCWRESSSKPNVDQAGIMGVGELGEKLPFLEPEPYIEDEVLGQDVRVSVPERSRQRKHRRRWGWITATALLASLSAAMGAYLTRIWVLGSLDSTCLRRSSRPSPLTNDLSITYHATRFNGSLLMENVYRLEAGPEVDAAWEALGVNYRSIAVPESEAARIGLASDQVKIRPEHGGGYPANVEGLHQLHCLNLVRQALFYNYEYYHTRGEGAFRNTDYILRKHVSHCLDIVRQQLMCTVDIGVMGQAWFQPTKAEHPEAYVDFNTEHVCRNFDDVRKWAEERQIPPDVPSDFLLPPKAGDRVYHTIP